MADEVFVAVKNFSVAGERFRAGEVVPRSSPALEVVLRFGGRFVTPKPAESDRPRPPRRSPRGPQPGLVTEQPDLVEPAVPAPEQTDQPPDGDVVPTGE